MISSSRINIGSCETSHSSEINSAKRARDMYEGTNQKFKGIVPQQNGHWGAQIYTRHQRIWLGTFKSETEAAMAYDSASMKLRTGDSHRNIPWNDETAQEPHFQSHYNAETVLNMIRNGTYPSKFAAFLRTHQGVIGNGVGGALKHVSLGMKGAEEQFSCTHLFQKELTPSDVGKLNRLVIPKKHAVTYLPYICDGSSSSTTTTSAAGAAETNDVDTEVDFYDRVMRLWKFRYCYWKSSQSYVFTRGWNRFVKDKNLKAKDKVVFYMCEPAINRTKRGEGEGSQVFLLIDVIYNAGERRRHCFGEGNQILAGNRLICSTEVEAEEEESRDRVDLNLNTEKCGVRLFGVRIN